LAGKIISEMTYSVSSRLINRSTLRYIKTLYSGLSKSHFKDHYGDATKG